MENNTTIMESIRKVESCLTSFFLAKADNQDGDLFVKEAIKILEGMIKK